jgi:hypothetical protein
MRRATLILLFLAFLTLQTAAAQDSLGEYSKGMSSYKAYDYEKACKKLTNFVAASNGLHEIPADVLRSVKESGRTVAEIDQEILQDNNTHDVARSCADNYRRALLLAIDGEWMMVDRALRAAAMKREELMERATAKSKPDEDTQSEGGDNSLAAIVAASKNASSGEEGCAPDDALHKFPEQVPTCVNHLLTLARKQKTAGQLMMAKLNFQRAIEVNAYLGANQDAAVKSEAVRKIHEIERAQRLER